jgi:hypothetical protein
MREERKDETRGECRKIKETCYILCKIEWD